MGKIKNKYPSIIKRETLLTPVEAGLLCSLISSNSDDGWMVLKEIFEKRHETNKQSPKDIPLFSQAKTSLPRYIRQLEKKGLVERREIMKEDRQHRPSTPFQYRINPNKRISAFNQLLQYQTVYNSYQKNGFMVASYFYQQCINKRKDANFLGMYRDTCQKHYEEYMSVMLSQSKLLGYDLNKIIFDIKQKTEVN